MANPVFDAGSSGSAVNGPTFSHTCTGSNLVLLVFARAGSNNSSGASDLVATYNGVSMTQVTSYSGDANHGAVRSFILIAPATGAHNVVVTDNNAVGYTVIAHAVSYTSAKQSAQPDASSNGTDETSPYDSTVTTVADNCAVVSFWTNAEVGTFTASTNTTSRVSASASLTGDYYPKTPAGSLTMSATGTATRASEVAISLAPFVASTNNLFFAARL